MENAFFRKMQVENSSVSIFLAAGSYDFEAFDELLEVAYVHELPVHSPSWLFFEMVMYSSEQPYQVDCFVKVLNLQILIKINYVQKEEEDIPITSSTSLPGALLGLFFFSGIRIPPTMSEKCLKMFINWWGGSVFAKIH